MAANIKKEYVSLFKCQGTNGTNLHAFSALAADRFSNGFVLEGGDHSLETSSGEADGSDSQPLLAYPDTFTTEDTLVGIIGKEGTAVIYGKIPFDFFKSF